MPETEYRSAAAEFAAFKRERREAGKAGERGETEPTIAFKAKWYGRYPQFDNPRSSAFRNFNAMHDYLAEKYRAEKEATPNADTI